MAQVFALTATQIFATIREGQVVDPGSPYLTFNGFWCAPAPARGRRHCRCRARLGT